MVEKHNCTDTSVTLHRRSSVTSGGRINRQHSITRGTASSIAKMVRPQDHEQPHSHHHHHHHNNGTKNKKKRNSGITTKKNSTSKEDSRRKSWCPTIKKRISRLSPNNSDSHIVNASNDRMQYKRDSIDSLTTATTASSHEEDHVPKPTRSIKPFPKILKPFKEDDALLLDTPDCKQKDNTDLLLEKHPDDFHNASHYMTHESHFHKSQPSLSKNTSSSDDDLPTTPVDPPSPCCSPIPDHQIEKSIEEESEQVLKSDIPVKSILASQLEDYPKTPTITTYSNTIVHHTRQRDDKLCYDLSQQLWRDVEETHDTPWTRIKWNLSQWIGFGLGEIRDKDYDDDGHPKNIVISGLCVTAEPGLLPKRLLNKQGLAYHTYLLEITRQKRLEQFRMISQDQWVPDTQVSTCEFATNNGVSKPCTVRFNLFNRRHHCRSCGHIFCQSHSANRLPLFHTDNKGEWVRVCDICLYSRVKPFLK